MCDVYEHDTLEEHRAPSAQLRACNGNDIIKSGRQRKNRYLVSLPGLIAPHVRRSVLVVSIDTLSQAGGRVGTLTDIHTARPVLVLDVVGLFYCGSARTLDRLRATAASCASRETSCPRRNRG